MTFPSAPLARSFQDEQQVQLCIAYIQKAMHLPIWQIDVTAIREGIQRGRTPHDLAVQYYRSRES